MLGKIFIIYYAINFVFVLFFLKYAHDGPSEPLMILTKQSRLNGVMECETGLENERVLSLKRFKTFGIPILLGPKTYSDYTMHVNFNSLVMTRKLK